LIFSLTSVSSVVQLCVEILLTHFSIFLYDREYQSRLLLNSYVLINVGTPISLIQILAATPNYLFTPPPQQHILPNRRVHIYLHTYTFTYFRTLTYLPNNIPQPTYVHSLYVIVKSVSSSIFFQIVGYIFICIRTILPTYVL